MPAARRNQARTTAAHGQLERELRRFIDAGGNTTHAFGLGRLIGRMYALLYLEAEPLSLQEIARRLKISKAGASTAIRQLRQWNGVVLRRCPGDRRDFYEAQTDFAAIVREGLLPGLRQKMASAGLQIGRTLDAGAASTREAGGRASPRVQLLRQRLQAARDLHRKLDAIFSSPLLESMLLLQLPTRS
jgi:DNA-binding transcriptional regulator GbsR (MarR family)